MAGSQGHVVPIGDGEFPPEWIGLCLQDVGWRTAPDLRWLATRLPLQLAGWWGVKRLAAEIQEVNEEMTG